MFYFSQDALILAQMILELILSPDSLYRTLYMIQTEADLSSLKATARSCSKSYYKMIFILLEHTY